ncbi:hypothetical protein JCM33374_g6140 [Metschnikowia sp. JCM 33374]|nr:hypothetical protein JCM33374_g6140 [Metschnikowia sp. JCM 33374]
MSLETQRQLLEELNVLEKACTQRFRRNPALRSAAKVRQPDDVLESKAKRPHLETLSQQHELEYFSNQYQADADRCRGAFVHETLAKEISAMSDPDMTFKHIMATIQNIDAKYRHVSPGSASSMIDSFAMYSSAPRESGVGSDPSGSVGSVEPKPMKSGKVKRKYHLSLATQHIDAKLKSAFSEAESYGKYVDLALFYEMHKALSGSQQTYVEYLQSFLKFEGCPRTPQYSRYLDSLLSYLKGFYTNAFPLEKDSVVVSPTGDEGDQKEGHQKSARTNCADNEKHTIDSEGSPQPNDKGEVFCKACDKLFAKESVYKGHLSGKKHKKNEQRANTSSPSVPSHEKAPPYKTLEAQIATVAEKLQPVFEATINDYQRRSRFSDREQQLERLAVEGELSDYTAVESDSDADKSDPDDDDDLDDAFAKDLPLGADGIPIPLWLYKLQGLHRTYSCEICGNVAYKGRKQFNKHFGSSKHVYGLMCLGVSEQDTGLYANISSIAEVEELRENLKKNKIAEQVDDENDVEVEDDEGNVMSRKDYDELKKQGLI